MATQPRTSSQIMDPRSPAFSRITPLRQLDISRRDSTIKVRVIRLWKQPMKNQPGRWYSLEMILVDEEGTTIQANILSRWIEMFENILRESECYFIVKPTIGINDLRNKHVDNPNKLGIYCDSHIYLCNDFTGPTFGFNFTSFDPIIGNTLPENHPLDVIGFVNDVKPIKRYNVGQPNESRKLNVILQDENMKTIELSLWNTFADRVLEVWEKKEENLIVLILQFGTIKYFLNKPYVNNAFTVSKLFINADNDETIAFKKSILETPAVSSCSSQSSKLSGTFLSLFDEFLVKHEFQHTAEVNLDEVKTVIVVGTISMISEHAPWYYTACKKCLKKVKRKPEDMDTPAAELLELPIEYECKSSKCLDNPVEVIQRLIVPLTVQDSSGYISLTLFDREGYKILKKTAAELVEKYLSGGYNGIHPDEFQEILGKKFAFKIEVKQYNLDNKSMVFGINKLTDDVDIIFELEKKANNLDVENSESFHTESNQFGSQATLKLKDTVESIADNVTPISKEAPVSAEVAEVSNEKSQLNAEATFKRRSKNPDFKRKLVESYDVEELGDHSATKTISNGKKALLTPKVEK